MQSFEFAEILLPLPLDSTYTYIIPEEYSEKLEIGFRVLVNLGKRKIYTGIVVDLHNNIPEFESKPIISVVDDEAFVNSKQLELWRWISAYYCCSLGEVMNAATPGILIPSSETKFFYNDNNNYEEELSNAELKIIDLLQNNNQLNISEVIAATDLKNPIKILESLEKKNIISFDQNLKKTYKPLFKNVVVFDIGFIEESTDAYEKILKQNSKQKEIIEYLAYLSQVRNLKSFEIAEKQLLDDCDALKSSLKSLESKGLIKLLRIPESRILKSESNIDSFEAPCLTENQLVAYNTISNIFEKKQPVLLHGVTSSGKTEIYIKLIEKALNDGREVLYLLPEIALTSQIIERLKKYFGNKIGVFHSKYSSNIRSEVYKSVLKSELKIILGVRSAIFLPFNNLGLVIIDEEHETSYKQFDPDPRYNARDMAVVLAKIHGGNVILGSATPSIESYYNALSGKYSLVELNQRFGNVKLPEIVIADVKDAYRRKIMNAHFHPLLVKNISEALERNEQIILFQNRRGYSPYLECKDCGWVPYCKNCNVSLTYHKYENKLVCHYCGEKFDVVNKCPSCSSTKLSTKGFGTERIEDEIQVLFPSARIARLDYDTASTRKKFEKILTDFQSHKLDILIGTQMVTKGLDFAKVSLVGILNADNMLNFPDFRAFERAFQLMLQVSGRAGRRDEQGKVVIQTFDVAHPVISQVISNDYISLYNSQMEERSMFKYPPYWNFIIIKLKHRDRDRLHYAANLLGVELKKELFERVKGPEEPLVNRVNNLYILNIHLRFEKKISAVKIKEVLIHKCKILKSCSDYSSISIEIDVDPM